ncbi:ABC transporter permease [Halorubellus litoreus]|uniref:ABC transporter permease n=1 Tax=Halorubellus litoreus TaxID=755308 RepID=A0ABD5VME7_9EURY
MSGTAATAGDDGPAPRDGNSFVGDAWANCKRWHRKALRNPFVIVVVLVQPIVALLLFTEVFRAVGAAALAETGLESVEYVTFLLPAVVVQAALAAAISSGVGTFDDIRSGMFEKVLVSPMSTGAVFAGKAAAELARIVVQVLVVVALGVAIGARIETGLLGVVGIVLVAVLFALWFMAVSNAIALVVETEEVIIAVANLLQFPLLFLSSGLLPLGAFPDWVRAVAAVNPVSYAVDAVRALVLGGDAVTVVSVSGLGPILGAFVPAVCLLAALTFVCGAFTASLMARFGDDAGA